MMCLPACFSRVLSGIPTRSVCLRLRDAMAMAYYSVVAGTTSATCTSPPSCEIISIFATRLPFLRSRTVHRGTLTLFTSGRSDERSIRASSTVEQPVVPYQRHRTTLYDWLTSGRHPPCRTAAAKQQEHGPTQHSRLPSHT